MKINYKFPFILILIVLSTFGCMQSNVAPDPGGTADGAFVKMVSEYADGSFEETRIKYLKYDPVTGAPLRVLANLVVDGDMTLDEEAEYGVIEIKKGTLTIDYKIKVGNVNFINGSNKVIIHVTVAGFFKISSSLNMNGNVEYFNNGVSDTGNVEMQNGKNRFVNNFFHYVRGDLQVTSSESTYENCGSLEVTANTNIHNGTMSFCKCGTLVTHGLNINRADGITGEGYIRVIATLNLNHRLTVSAKILFAYYEVSGIGDKVDKPINDPSKLGAAVRVFDNSCGGSMPLRFVNLDWTTEKNTENNVVGVISFDVTENSGLVSMKILTSVDGKNWNVVVTEQPDAFAVGKSYRNTFPLPKN